MGGRTSKTEATGKDNPAPEITTDIREKPEKEEKVTEPQVPPVSYLQLFRYASTADKIFMVIGTLAAAASGITMPGMVLIFGQITDELVNNGNPDPCGDSVGNGSTIETTTYDMEKIQDSLLNTIGRLALYQVYLGTGQLVVGYFFISSFNRVSENVVYKLRQKYLAGLLRQNVGWYDTNQDKNFVSRIAEDCIKVQEATGEKLGLCIFFLSSSILSLANAFWHGWLLTLVVLSSAPVLAIAAAVVTTIQSKLAATEQTAYAKAGTTAEEALTNIRTVMAFSGQHVEMERYEEGLEFAKKAGKKRGAISGFGMGLIWLILYASYALAFWYGTKLILDGQDDYCEDREKTPQYTAQNMLIVFFSVLMLSFNLGQSASYFEAFAVGRGSAAYIYLVIDRMPEIDSYSESGLKPKGRARGKLRFQNVSFSYPSRPDVSILKDFTLNVEPGQTVALVGHSGCGKSTCLQLLQRFYDPIEGKVIVDDTDIRDLHLGWLRSQIGIVSQEPVLFNTTIAENVRYGRDGVTMEEIIEASKQANAHMFIEKLPNGYQTLVGDRGAQLSGGQKQRVAIARALVRNPSILLLDEATSALDTQSESVVQAALDRARKGRTTLIVAHRLSTIRAADVVVSLSEGQVLEKGTHDELLEKKGLYFQLVTAQMAGSEESSDDYRNEDDEEFISNNNKDLERQYSKKSFGGADEVAEYVPPTTEDSLSEKELAKQAPLRRLLKMNMPEWHWMAVGTVCAMIQGFILPIFAIIFGEFLGVLALSDRKEAREESNTYALYFLMLGLIAGVSMFFQLFAFSVTGEQLTGRLRKLAFQAMMRQEPGWFDDPSNSVGSLSARLSGDAASVQGATGSRIGSVVQALSTIGLAIGLSMYYLPKLGAVALAFVPLVGVTTYFEALLMTGQNVKEKRAVEESAKVAVQAVSNIRTVASLGREQAFVRMYNEELQSPHKLILKRSHIRGLNFGTSQAMPLFAYAAVLYYGSYLIKNEGANYEDIFKVAESLIFGSMMVSQTLAFAPNYNKAKISGSRILRLLDRRPAVENSPGVGLQIRNSEGKVGFKHVGFHYPTRPSAQILRDLSLDIDRGMKIALVGPSGSGKSTCVQLILRFYDPITGKVKLDGVDVASLNVDALRSQMAIVAQEPALFDRTIRENICYGDNSREVTMQEIIEAARMANIHEFIERLPAGYETRVGEMGSQLSGGQKQRVAIARALVRNPKVLLLDEATSALDMESEQVVQAALDVAAKGRTSITIAHRLASIQNVDKIIVINNGKVAESGTHQELLQQHGIYHNLWNMQGGGPAQKRNGRAHVDE